MATPQPTQPKNFADVLEQMARTMRNATATEVVIRDIRAERRAQDERWGEQNHPDIAAQPAWPEWSVEDQRRVFAQVADKQKSANERAVASDSLDWAAILIEEVYEAFAESDPALLRAELVQVAAVATAWIEHLDRRAAREKEEG